MPCANHCWHCAAWLALGLVTRNQSIASPLYVLPRQRYAHAAGSSDEEEVVEEEGMPEGDDGGGEAGRRSGGARSSGGRRGPQDGGGGSGGASITEGTEEPYEDAMGDTMDEHGLSDVIDASVELTVGMVK